MDRTGKKTLAKICHHMEALILMLALSGCMGNLLTRASSPPPGPNRTQYESDENALTQWTSLFNAKDYHKVDLEIGQFLQNNGNTQHWYAILFLHGRTKEALEDWIGAAQVYRKIIERSTDQQLEFVALADYRLAYCYEVLLENEKALAALNDLNRLNAYLPLEVSLAEIPARIASIYARLNQPTLADTYTIRAEKGIRQLRATKKNSDPDWLSRTLIKMGGISLTQVDEDSFKQNLLTLTRNQRYLIQAIELQHPTWAPEAQKILVSTYTNLWTFMNGYKVKPTKDWEADLVVEAKRKSDYLTWYLEALERLKSYRAPEDSAAFQATQEVYQQMATLEQQAILLLNQELLKKPWTSHQPPGHATTSPLRSAESTIPIETESEEGREHKTHSLPKKKTK